MSLPKMTTAVDNISKLDTRPNAVNGLTADELKAKFDKAPEDIKRFLNEVLIPALDGAITLDALGAVPTTRKVNGQALSADVTVSAEDVPAFGPDQLKRTTQYLLDELAIDVSKAVPKTRTVAGKTLDKDIALAAEDVGYSKTVGGVTVEGTVKTELNSLNAAMGGKVPTTRKVNGKPLDADVTLDAASIDYAGAIPDAANVKAALDALNAKKDVAVFSATLSGETLSSAATFPEISAAYSAGKQVLLQVDTSGGIYWLLPLVRFLGGMVASFAAWVSNSRLAVATLSYSAASTPPVNAWSLTQVPLSAESVAYSATIDGTAVQDVDAALDALNARKAVTIVTVTATDGGATADMTLSQIVDAYGAGREVKCLLAEGSNSTLLSLLKISTTVARFYGQTSAAMGKVVTFLENGNVAVTQAEAQAANVKYSGKVGSDTVANVKAALDGLAIGKPLDMTADYVASGAEDPLGWAAMAKVVNGTASTTEYRVAPGRYYIGRENMQNGWIVDIIDFHAAPFRAIIAIGGGDEPCPRFMATVTDTVGSSNVSITGISVYGDDIGCVTWYGDNYRLVPEPTNNDEGKFLKCTGYGVMEWASLPTYDGGVS